MLKSLKYIDYFNRRTVGIASSGLGTWIHYVFIDIPISRNSLQFDIENVLLLIEEVAYGEFIMSYWHTWKIFAF